MAKPAMTQSCCCCGDLRIGSMVIIVIQSVCAMIALISAASTLSSGNYADADHQQSRIVHTSNGEFDVKNYTTSKSSLIIQIAFTLLSFIFNGCAFYGAYKRFHSYILPWVVYNGIIFSLNILVILIMAILLGIAYGASVGFVIFIVGGIVLGVFIYMWCVVYSYYAVLQEENSRGLYDKQPYRR